MQNHPQEFYQIISIMRATVSDSRSIWEWRNDQKTKEMSKSSDIVTWDEHVAWYQKCLSSLNSYLYIGYLNCHEKIGICRFDISFVPIMTHKSWFIESAF